MNSEDVKAIERLLSERQKIVIVPHKNPDGDAIGSALGICHYLNDLGHDTAVISPNDFPRFLKWLPGNDLIVNFEKNNSLAVDLIDKATIIFTMDFNHLSRIGHMKEILEEAKARFIMIDHHQSPSDYAAITYSDASMSSTCEMVFNFIEALDGVNEISPDIANCLYTGIMTDTGSFKFSSTTSRTHRVIAELIDKGADNTMVHHKIFDTNSSDRVKLLGCALGNLVLLNEYNTAYITLSQEELDAHNYRKGDTEGFVNYGLTVEGIKFAAIFIENREEGIIKISFRSFGDFSVNDFARAHYQGGGHINAAGGKSEFTMKATTERFKELLKQYKDQLTS